MTTNNDHLIAILLASIGFACPIVPLCPILSMDEIVCILAKIKPSIIFCDAKLLDRVNKALNESRLKFIVKVFTFEQHTSDVESVENLFQKTDRENSFA